MAHFQSFHEQPKNYLDKEGKHFTFIKAGNSVSGSDFAFEGVETASDDSSEFSCSSTTIGVAKHNKYIFD